MNKKLKTLFATVLLCAVVLSGCGGAPATSGSDQGSSKTETSQSAGNTSGSTGDTSGQSGTETTPAKDWTGDDEEGVALYLETYSTLPDNYMTKAEARKQGWEGGALHLVVEGMCIGGDRFGNYEKQLPTDKQYQECDIDTLQNEQRGSKRIIYSVEEDDLDIWYTGDHYKTFTLIYGDGK